MTALPKRARKTEIDFPKLYTQFENGSPMIEVWKSYASKAAKPYEFHTFQAYMKRWKKNEEKEAVEIPDTFAASEEFWSERLSPTSKLLTVEGNAPSLAVKHGNLRLWDRVTGANTFTPAGSKPHALVFMGWGGTISIEAMRWCNRNDVAVFAIDRNHDLLSFIHPGSAQEAALIRAQLAANPLKIAKALVVKKFEHMRAAKGLTIEEAAKSISSARKAATVADLMRVEGITGLAYWPRFRCEMRPRGRAAPPFEAFMSRKGPLKNGRKPIAFANPAAASKTPNRPAVI